MIIPYLTWSCHPGPAYFTCVLKIFKFPSTCWQLPERPTVRSNGKPRAMMRHFLWKSSWFLARNKTCFGQVAVRFFRPSLRRWLVWACRLLSHCASNVCLDPGAQAVSPVWSRCESQDLLALNLRTSMLAALGVFAHGCVIDACKHIMHINKWYVYNTVYIYIYACMIGIFI